MGGLVEVPRRTARNKYLGKLVASEMQEQAALVKWLSYHPVLKDFYHKNDNEGKRTPQQGYQLKQAGLRRGVPDIFIYYPTNKYHGLYIEVKKNKIYVASAQLTDTWRAQKAFMERVQKVGYAAHFCYGWEEGKSIIENYLSENL